MRACLQGADLLVALALALGAHLHALRRLERLVVRLRLRADEPLWQATRTRSETLSVRSCTRSDGIGRLVIRLRLRADELLWAFNATLPGQLTTPLSCRVATAGDTIQVRHPLPPVMIDAQSISYHCAFHVGNNIGLCSPWLPWPTQPGETPRPSPKANLWLLMQRQTCEVKWLLA